MERIKAYFENEIKTDAALAEVYNESKLEKCWSYIKDQARKQAKNGCAMIEDSVVYKWARDYMYGDVEVSNPVEPYDNEEEVTMPAETMAEEKETVEEETVIQIPEEPIVEKAFQEEAETQTCGDCGYCYKKTCQYHGYKVQMDAKACKEFILAAKEKHIKPLKVKVVQEEEQPSLFDFDDLN